MNDHSQAIKEIIRANFDQDYAVTTVSLESGLREAMVWERDHIVKMISDEIAVRRQAATEYHGAGNSELYRFSVMCADVLTGVKERIASEKL